MAAQTDVFVVCSNEFLTLPWQPPPAEIVHRSLDGALLKGADVTVNVNIWDEWSADHPGEIFQLLDLAAKTHEWAVVIFRADDLRRRMDEVVDKAAVRENVLFELGLFYGQLGAMRVFILEDSPTEVPSDIYSIHRLRFDSPATFESQLDRVVKIMDERSAVEYARWAPASSLAIGYVRNVIEPFVKQRRIKRPGKFTVQVLLPTDDFRGTQVEDVRDMFTEAECVQIGPTGTTDQRPLLWAKRNTLPAKGRRFSEVYFDVPTTLLTADQVIDDYLGKENATPAQKLDLVQSQANSFANVVKQKATPGWRHMLDIQRFSSMDCVGTYMNRA